MVWALNRRGAEGIVVCDRLGSTEKWRNLAPLRFADYLEADELLPRLQSGALGRFDLAIHLGACSRTTEKDAAFLIRNNFEFTKDLAAWALAHKTRFVYASSAATYGNGEEGMSDMENRLERFRPLNMYGYSKHLFDLHARCHGWLAHITGLKYFNVFGPNENHKGEMRSLVQKSHGSVVQSGVIRLFKSGRPDYPDGGQQRDFLYVKDAAAMTLHLAAHPTAVGLFNLGSGVARAWNDLARAVFAALGREPVIEYVEMPDSLRGQYQYDTRADIGRLRASGYDRAITSLEDAVADYVRNYLVPGKLLGDGAGES